MENVRQQYLLNKKKEFNQISDAWDSVKIEAPEKSKQLLRSSIKPNISRGESVPRQISINLSIEADTSELKEYINEIKETLEDASSKLKRGIFDMDRTLDEALASENEDVIFADTVNELLKWTRYCSDMSFELLGRNFEIEVPDDIKAIERKWGDNETRIRRKAEAKEYGVEIGNLDRHKEYIRLKQDLENANSSANAYALNQKLKELKGYLDSDDLAKKAEEKASLLKEKEEQQERIRKEKEEAKKRAEEERRQKIIDEWKSNVATIKKQRQEKKASILSEIKQRKEETIGLAEKAYNDSILEITDTLSESKRKLEEENTEFETLGFFKFSRKKELKESIEKLQQQIQRLENDKVIEKDKLTRKIEEAQRDEEKRKKGLDAELDTQFVIPENPIEVAERKAKEKAAAEERTRRLSTNDGIKNEIYNVLALSDNLMTVTDIQERLDFEISNVKLSSLLRQLVADGKIERVEDKRKAYFRTY